MKLSQEQLNELTNILANISAVAHKLSLVKHYEIASKTDMWACMEKALADNMLHISRILCNDITNSNHDKVGESIERIRTAINSVVWMLQGAEMALGIKWDELKENRDNDIWLK